MRLNPLILVDFLYNNKFVLRNISFIVIFVVKDLKNDFD